MRERPRIAPGERLASREHQLAQLTREASVPRALFLEHLPVSPFSDPARDGSANSSQGEALDEPRSANPAATLPALRAAVHAADPLVPLRDARLVERQLDLVLMPQRFGATLLTVFGLVALAITAVGIYGMVAYTVSQRAREIGIRSALGARCGDILRLVLQRTGVALAAGTVVGMGAAAVATRPAGHFLYGVTATDPTAFVTAARVLVLTALIVALGPAPRELRLCNCHRVVAVSEEHRTLLGYWALDEDERVEHIPSERLPPVRRTVGRPAQARDQRERGRVTNRLHREVHVELRPVQMVGRGPFDIQQLLDGCPPKPRELPERH